MKKRIFDGFLLTFNGFICSVLLALPVGLLMGVMIKTWFIPLIILFIIACIVFKQLIPENRTSSDNKSTAPVVILCTRVPSVIVGAAVWGYLSRISAPNIMAVLYTIAFTLTSCTLLAAAVWMCFVRAFMHNYRKEK